MNKISVVYIVDGFSMVTWTSVGKKKLRKICKKHGLPFKKTRKIIEGLAPGTHSVYIDVPVYLKGLRK